MFAVPEVLLCVLPCLVCGKMLTGRLLVGLILLPALPLLLNCRQQKFLPYSPKCPQNTTVSWAASNIQRARTVPQGRCQCRIPNFPSDSAVCAPTAIRPFLRRSSYRSPCSGQRSAAERGEPAIRLNTRALREVSCCSICVLCAFCPGGHGG